MLDFWCLQVIYDSSVVVLWWFRKRVCVNSFHGVWLDYLMAPQHIEALIHDHGRVLAELSERMVVAEERAIAGEERIKASLDEIRFMLAPLLAQQADATRTSSGILESDTSTACTPPPVAPSITRTPSPPTVTMSCVAPVNGREYTSHRHHALRSPQSISRVRHSNGTNGSLRCKQSKEKCWSGRAMPRRWKTSSVTSYSGTRWWRWKISNKKARCSSINASLMVSSTQYSSSKMYKRKRRLVNSSEGWNTTWRDKFRYSVCKHSMR